MDTTPPGNLAKNLSVNKGGRREPLSSLALDKKVTFRGPLLSVSHHLQE